MPVKLEEAYKKEISNALEKCQFIEEMLRMCILKAAEIARVQLSPYFPVKYTSEDISKLPLGALVSIFSKINADTVLLSSLKTITRDRNEVAHKSLLLTLGELRDEKHMTEATQKVKEIEGRAIEIHHRLLDIRNEFIRSLHEAKRSAAQIQP